MIKTKLVVICSDKVDKRRNIKNFSKIQNFTLDNECIYFDLSFLIYLHLHSNIFRKCDFTNIYNILLKKYNVEYENEKICKKLTFTHFYSIITTVYKRNNLKQQILLFLNQTLPPKYIIIAHDRNLVKVSYTNFNIIYFHTINFKAGYYFRYLLSILSPTNEVLIYDDDWFPYNKSAHLNWINDIKNEGNFFFGHHSSSKNGVSWCATPIIIHREWIYLMWLYDIYETKAAEDGHLSFSLLLLCNIQCKSKKINGLNYISDNLSSSSTLNISKSFWNDYTIKILNKRKSVYVYNIKRKYYIY